MGREETRLTLRWSYANNIERRIREDQNFLNLSVTFFSSDRKLKKDWDMERERDETI